MEQVFAVLSASSLVQCSTAGQLVRLTSAMDQRPVAPDTSSMQPNVKGRNTPALIRVRANPALAKSWFSATAATATDATCGRQGRGKWDVLVRSFLVNHGDAAHGSPQRLCSCEGCYMHALQADHNISALVM